MLGKFARVIAVSIALPSIVGFAAPAHGDDSPIVNTQEGPVRGLARDGVRLFRGIPYAAPPVRNMRWRAPQPHPAWTAPLDATKFGASCPQVLPGRARGGLMSEDCLFLNVFAPDPPGSGLPVMLWIHGGAFVFGSGSGYDGSVLAAKHKMIVVTINYRLGALGFLAMPGLDIETQDRVSGNYGLLDQQEAMRWVKRNIAAFGGDPHRITIAGESAGGTSVCLQLVSPQASGLFARAINESGPCLYQRSIEEAEKRGHDFAAKLGCDKESHQVGCLRSKSADELLAAMPGSPVGPLVWAPVMDGHLIPMQPEVAFRNGTFNKVPVINGSNHDEGTLFIAFGRPLPKEDYAAAVESFARPPQGESLARAQGVSDGAQKVLAAYPIGKYPSPSQGLAAVMGDAIFSCGIERAGELMSRCVPTYQYEFNDREAPPTLIPNPPFPLGAYHVSEIQYVFQSYFPGERRSGAPDFSPAQAKLSNQIAGYWSAFIASGDPDGSSPKWAPMKPGQVKILSLAPDGVKFESGFAQDHHCALWDSIGQ